MKRILILLLLGVWLTDVKAQDDSSTVRNIISFNATNVLIREITVSYERFISHKSSFELTTGVKIPKNTDKAVREGQYDLVHLFLPYEYSHNVSLSYKLSLRKRQKNGITQPNYHVYGPYISVSTSYRYRAYENKCYEEIWGTGSASFARIDSKNQNIYGLNLVIGQRYILFSLNERLNILVDVFTGLGVQYRKINNTIYASEVGGSHSCEQIPWYSTPRMYNRDQIAPSFHIGAKIGLGLK